MRCGGGGVCVGWGVCGFGCVVDRVNGHVDARVQLVGCLFFPPQERRAVRRWWRVCCVACLWPWLC